MTTFLIQASKTEYGLLPQHDFSFEVIQTIEFDTWFHNEKRYNYELVASIEEASNNLNYIPVGSVEFICQFLKERYGINNVKPINIPECLIPVTRRTIVHLHKNDIDFIDNKVFVKSATTIKGFTGIVSNKSEFPEDFYTISDVIDITSEF